MNKKAVLQVVGYKNSGKTTTCCKIIKEFVDSGWEVGSVKNDAHDFELDQPGKDTWLHREAGASVVAITSQYKTAIMEQRPSTLAHLISRIEDVDVIIVEGYKFEDYPKIVMLRNEQDINLISETKEILAIYSWISFDHPSIPVVQIDRFDELFVIIKNHIEKQIGVQGQ